ncbi:hypothetical protein AMECASPLE_011989 [Ameca splendens]|uniref:Ig-like domain-containing protein n=1 Tax=Ameca splendens TaxID=208324 RepID=A0ABV1A887_9TELE
MPAAVFLYLLLLKTVFCSSASKGQRIFTVEPGQNILLPCRAPDNRPVIAAEWSRADLDPEYVFLYRDEQVVPFYQHPSFRNRVDLQDRKMKDGDVSLVLKNVTMDDRGTYECRVFQTGNKIRKRANLDSDPISIIILDVAPSPPPGVSRGRWNKVSRNKAGSVGPTVSLLMLVLHMWVW